MAFEVNLYRFEKKVNSTKQPIEPSWHATFQATPRRGVSVLAPVLAITSTEEYPLIGYNYAYIPRYKRYYWITDIKVDPNNLWWVYLSCDVLATYKTDIQNSTEYVARSASAYVGTIEDGMYPSKAGSYLAMTSKVSPWVSDLYSGTYVVGIINGISGATSTAVTYYAFTAAQYANLLDKLQNQTTMANILGITVKDGIVQGLTGCLQDISYDVYIAQLNPIQYIVSSVYIPIGRASLDTGASTNVDIGRWRIPDFVAPTIGYRAVVNCGTIDIPHHPQAADRGEYLNNPPHSVYSMHFPGFGVIELNGTRVSRRPVIRAKVVFDPYNGNGYLYLSTDDPDEDEGALGILTGNIGIPVPVTQMLATDLRGNLIANVAKIASNVLDNRGGVAKMTKANPQHFVPAMFAEHEQAITGESPAPEWNAIFDGVQSIPTLSMSGSVGGSSGLYGNWWVKLEYFLLVDEDNESLGRPLMQMKLLANCGGYTQCINPHVICIGATAQESEMVNNYLSNGIFLE
nr:MAG TPA: hypothetical protein [Caudoviricetes sp.]